MTKAELIAELEATREVARTFYRWSLWLDHEMECLAGATDMDDLEERNQAGMEKYEQWRRVRESGIRNQYEWLKK